MTHQPYMHKSDDLLQLPACTAQACGQDSRKCPCPSACMVPWTTECERELDDWGDVFVNVCIVLLVVFVLAAVAASI